MADHAPIDLDRAVETFAAATDFTVGIEEEFSILDPLTLDLVPRFDELRDAALAADPVLGQHITGELIASEIFADHGFRVVAIFDNDPAKVGEQVGQHVVRHNDELRTVVEEQDIVVGVLAVPTAAAQGLADDLVAAGVKIIFNYSDALLNVPPETTVHTSSPAVDLLYALYFYLA